MTKQILDASLLHFVDRIPYTETLCGLSLDNVQDENWTDAIIEILDDNKTPEAGGICPSCFKKGKKIVRRFDASQESRLEYAREMGMLHGIDAYNEAMGY